MIVYTGSTGHIIYNIVSNMKPLHALKLTQKSTHKANITIWYNINYFKINTNRKKNRKLQNRLVKVHVANLHPLLNITKAWKLNGKSAPKHDQKSSYKPNLYFKQKDLISLNSIKLNEYKSKIHKLQSNKKQYNNLTCSLQNNPDRKKINWKNHYATSTINNWKGRKLFPNPK